MGSKFYARVAVSRTKVAVNRLTIITGTKAEREGQKSKEAREAGQAYKHNGRTPMRHPVTAALVTTLHSANYD